MPLVYNEVMNSYVNSLDPIARKRYEEKLTLLGLSTLEDPYELWKTDKFVEKMSLWPPVEYPHIFCYFVERPGVYTRSELMQWKSLDAYNYFQPEPKPKPESKAAMFGWLRCTRLNLATS